MKKTFLNLFVLLFISQNIFAAEWPGEKPRLVVVVVIDQFRADYLSRFKSEFKADGFNALIQQGAYFPYGEYDILQSMTGPGHATILTGAYPYQMGVPGNDWYDQKTHRPMYCVEDNQSRWVGTDETPAHAGTSPRNLIGTTVGDEYKNADLPGRVVAVALKDRAAIFLGGHRADLAMWFDKKSKSWVSSQFYLPNKTLPEWLVKFNKDQVKDTCHLDQPCGIEKTELAFEAAVNGYKLGQGEGTDILAVSFSSHDFAGHQFGLNSDEMHAMTLAEDSALARMRNFLKDRVPGGLSKITFVLTGDHGVPSPPDYLNSHRIPSGYIDEAPMVKEIDQVLNKKYGKPKSSSWIVHRVDFNFYVDEEAVQEKKASLSDVEDEIKKVLRKNPFFAHVFSRTDVEKRQLPPGMFERQILKTYYAGRSGHVIGIQKPFYINASVNKANHLTGYSYDRTVPIIFAGFGIKKGVYADKAEVVDIAPTLSFLLGVIPPALSEGHVLGKILEGRE